MVARKLTETDVKKIRDSQESSRELAKKYKVGRVTIARVRRNETYRADLKQLLKGYKKRGEYDWGTLKGKEYL